MVQGASSGVQNAQLVIGGHEGLWTMVDVANGATEQLDVDLFAGSSPAFETIAEARPGVDSLFLADPEVKKKLIKRVRANGGNVVKVGAEPAKNHAKSVVANASDAVVTTAAFAPRTPGRYEVSVRFQGEAAAAMSEVTRSRASGDAERIVAAAAEARRHGIVLNDPQYGVWHLSESVEDLVRSARHRLIVASKRVEEPGIIRDIQIADEGGVPVALSKYRKQYPLHANIVIADDRAYIGSGHLTKRVLTGGGSNGRISRELGVIIDDPVLVDHLARSLKANRFVRLDRHGIPTGFPLLGKIAIGAGVAGALGGLYLLAKVAGDASSKPNDVLGAGR
jgi:hypothetical protein